MYGGGRLACVVARRTVPFSEQSFVTNREPDSVSGTASKKNASERRAPAAYHPSAPSYRGQTSDRSSNQSLQRPTDACLNTTSYESFGNNLPTDFLMKGDPRKRGHEDGDCGDDIDQDTGPPVNSPSAPACLNGSDDTKLLSSQEKLQATRRSKRLRKAITTRSDSWQQVKPRELDVIVVTSASSVVVQRSSALMDRLLQRNRSRYAIAPRTKRVVTAMSVLNLFAKRGGRFVERTYRNDFKSVPDRLVLPSVVQALHNGVNSLAAPVESQAWTQGKAVNDIGAKPSGRLCNPKVPVKAPTKAPTAGTIIPHLNDVLIKGQASVTFSGNSYYERLVANYRKAYREAKSPSERSVIVSSIITTVKGLTPPGRFLEMKPNGALRETQDSVAMDCAACALQLGEVQFTTTAGAHDPSSRSGNFAQDSSATSKVLRVPGLNQGPTSIERKDLRNRKSASNLLGKVLFVNTTGKRTTASPISPSNKRPQSIVTSQLAHRFAPEAEVSSEGRRKVYAKHPLVSAVEVKQPSQAEFARIGLPRSTIGPPRLASQEGPVVKEPHMHDVLLGRGPQLCTHPGNLRYRRLVWENKGTYADMSKLNKTDFALDLMNTIRNMDPPGRFLRYVGEQEAYIEVEVQRIIDKTLQALRERKWLDQSSVLKGDKKPEKAKSLLQGSSKKPDSPLSVRKGRSIGLTLTEAESVAVQDLPPGDDVYDKAVDKKLAVWTRISVYWPLDKAFYTARILDRQKFDVLLQYEDDDLVEWVDLTRHAFRILR